MKKMFLIPLTLMLWLFSCQKENEFTEEREIKQNEDALMTRGFSYNTTSVSNPNLHKNWEIVDSIYLNGGGRIIAPWKAGEGNSMNIPENYRTDIKKVDGWKMLSHTMLDQSDLEPNYMLFYNKYTGILKIFYYDPIGHNNENLVWVLEANQPTSILPSNTLVQSTFNSVSKFITTSNIIDACQINFGQLNKGWNAFSFELPYGSINNAPILSIKAYNEERSRLTLKGDYSGEVIIPITTSSSSNILSSITSSITPLATVLKVSPSVITKMNTVNKAISTVGKIFGNTSLFKSKSSVSNIHATSSGKITLSGNSFSTPSGIVHTCNGINIRKYNEEDLGLWNLRRNPQIYYEECVRMAMLIPEHDGWHTYSGIVTPKWDYKQDLVINPTVRDEIISYRLISLEFFYQDRNISNFETEELVENSIYGTNLLFYVSAEPIEFDPTKPYAGPFSIAPHKFGDICVNVTLEFTYEDGSIFISSRNFKAEMNRIFNQFEIMQEYPDAVFI